MKLFKDSLIGISIISVGASAKKDEQEYSLKCLSKFHSEKFTFALSRALADLRNKLNVNNLHKGEMKMDFFPTIRFIPLLYETLEK